MSKFLIFATIWGVGGSLNLRKRTDFSNDLSDIASGISMPNDLTKADGRSLIDYYVCLEDQNWHLYEERVDNLQIKSDQVSDADLVIPTVDTDRH
jgi:dynein heavy chain 1